MTDETVFQLHMNVGFHIVFIQYFLWTINFYDMLAAVNNNLL